MPSRPAATAYRSAATCTKMDRVKDLRITASRFLQAAILGALGLALAVTSMAQEAEKPAPPKVTLAGVTVTPENPGPDTLCKLSVKLRNDGEKTASLFAFAVEINGQKLPVYDKELFAFPVEAGSTADLALFNFWSTETGRKAPADGKLKVEVRLVEAQWVTIAMEDDVEVWTPGSVIGGLPASASVTLQMKK